METEALKQAWNAIHKLLIEAPEEHQYPLGFVMAIINLISIDEEVAKKIDEIVGDKMETLPEEHQAEILGMVKIEKMQ